jgi:hypothetical protein
MYKILCWIVMGFKITPYHHRVKVNLTEQTTEES